MKNLSTFVAMAALCVAASAPAYAQEDVLRPRIPAPIAYGFELGGNYNMFSLDMQRTIGFVDSPYDAYLDGMGFSPYAKLSVDYSFTERFGAIFTLGFDQKRVGNERTGVADCIIPRPGGALIYDTTRLNLDWEVATNYLTLGLLGRFDAIGGLFFTAGPVMHFRMDSTSQTEIETLPDDSRCFFEDSSRQRVTDSRIQSKPSSRFGLEAAVGYRFAIGEQLAIVPQIRYQWMITPFIEDRPSGDKYQRFFKGESFGDATYLTNTQLNSIQVGVGLSYRP